LESGGQADLSGWGNPRLEPEIAVHVGPGGEIAGMGVAIELVDPDPAAKDPEAILAGDVFQRHTIFGPMVEGFREARGVRARVTRNGEEVAATDDATELTGDPVELVRHVARTLEAAGEQIQEGDVVICGSVVAALEVAPGDEVVVELDPLGTVSVRFAPASA
jgi:2-keto-4-pentenoate hydratase